ncbi:TPA: ead/Ea22-like family protein [Escherichia coli]|nr:ead/Ea22-like family protein [Escherichia coli]
MSNIDKQALREIAAAAVGAHERLSVMPPDDIFDISLAEGTQLDADITALNALNSAANPTTVLALLDEINALEETRINDVCRIAELTKQLELAKSKLNEQREYYEGVISDGSKRIAELEAREIKPAKGEVLVVVSGFTGCGKSAIAGEIEIAMKAIGVPVQWTNGDAEKRMTGADWLTAIEMYKPTVRIVEVNVPRAAGIRIKGE